MTGTRLTAGRPEMKSLPAPAPPLERVALISLDTLRTDQLEFYGASDVGSRNLRIRCRLHAMQNAASNRANGVTDLRMLRHR